MHIIIHLHIQNTIKLYHWMTTSYPRHIASDKLYEQLNSYIDKFVEVYIGKYDRPRLNNGDLLFTLQNLNDKAVINYLDSCIVYMTNDIFKFVKENDNDLLSIRDDIVAAINQTKYLFTLK